jgi:hypothetical protein
MTRTQSFILFVVLCSLIAAGLVVFVVKEREEVSPAPSTAKPVGIPLATILAGPPGSLLWWCGPDGEPLPPTADLVWHDGGPLDGAPCAVTWVPGRYARLDAGPRN